MVIREIAERCHEWNGEKDEFSDLVKRSVDASGLPARFWASKFDVAVSTVGRWMEGTTAPLKEVRSLVVSEMGEVLSEIAEREEVAQGLIGRCRRWEKSPDPEPDEFSSILRDLMDFSSHPESEISLSWFGVSPPTLRSWARGDASPSDSVQQEAIEATQKRLKGQFPD